MDETPTNNDLDEGWFAVALLSTVFVFVGGLYVAGLLSVGWGVK